MIGKLSKIFTTASKQTPLKSVSPIIGAPNSPQNIAKMAQDTSKILSENLASLQEFATVEAPKVIADQKTALVGLEQLSKNIKSMIK